MKAAEIVKSDSENTLLGSLGKGMLVGLSMAGIAFTVVYVIAKILSWF